MFKDYYQILEVPRDASHPEIKKSYRKLAKEHHPDSNLNMGDAGEGDQFLLVNEAYQVLGDSVSREEYNVRYDQITRITRPRRKQASTSVFSDAYSESYSEPFAEPFQEPFSEPFQETPFSEPGDFSESYEAHTKDYTPPQDQPQSKPERATRGLSKYYKLSWLVKSIAALCLLFALSIVVDYFMAQPSETQTMLEAILTTHTDETIHCTIKTNISEFPIDYKKYGYLGKGDQLILYTTPIYHVFSSIQIVDGDSIWPHYGIYNSFSIFLFLLLACSFVTLFLKNPAFVFRLGLATLILTLLTALILLQS